MFSELTDCSTSSISTSPKSPEIKMEGKLSTLIFTLICVSVTQAGVSYVRWGRTTCPQGNILLYKGFITGNHYLGKGNGGNFLCTTQKPVFQRAKAGMQTGTGKLWGVEFQLDPVNDQLFLKDNIPGGGLHNQDMVCARCHVPDSNDVFMLPGRNDCEDSGYEVQYKGYLVAEAQLADRSAHEYICLDETPEGRMGGTENDNQGLVYPIQFECGSLPCNPFVSGYEATCAVCSY